MNVHNSKTILNDDWLEVEIKRMNQATKEEQIDHVKSIIRAMGTTFVTFGDFNVMLPTRSPVITQPKGTILKSLDDLADGVYLTLHQSMRTRQMMLTGGHVHYLTIIDGVWMHDGLWNDQIDKPIKNRETTVAVIKLNPDDIRPKSEVKITDLGAFHMNCFQGVGARLLNDDLRMSFDAIIDANDCYSFFVNNATHVTEAFIEFVQDMHTDESMDAYYSNNFTHQQFIDSKMNTKDVNKNVLSYYFALNLAIKYHSAGRITEPIPAHLQKGMNLVMHEFPYLWPGNYFKFVADNATKRDNDVNIDPHGMSELYSYNGMTWTLRKKMTDKDMRPMYPTVRGHGIASAHDGPNPLSEMLRTHTKSAVKYIEQHGVNNDTLFVYGDKFNNNGISGHNSIIIKSDDDGCSSCNSDGNNFIVKVGYKSLISMARVTIALSLNISGLRVCILNRPSDANEHSLSMHMIEVQPGIIYTANNSNSGWSHGATIFESGTVHYDENTIYSMAGDYGTESLYMGANIVCIDLSNNGKKVQYGPMNNGVNTAWMLGHTATLAGTGLQKIKLLYDHVHMWVPAKLRALDRIVYAAQETNAGNSYNMGVEGIKKASAKIGYAQTRHMFNQLNGMIDVERVNLTGDEKKRSVHHLEYYNKLRHTNASGMHSVDASQHSFDERSIHYQKLIRAELVSIVREWLQWSKPTGVLYITANAQFVTNEHVINLIDGNNDWTLEQARWKTQNERLGKNELRIICPRYKTYLRYLRMALFDNQCDILPYRVCVINGQETNCAERPHVPRQITDGYQYGAQGHNHMDGKYTAAVRYNNMTAVAASLKFEFDKYGNAGHVYGFDTVKGYHLPQVVPDNFSPVEQCRIEEGVGFSGWYNGVIVNSNGTWLMSLKDGVRLSLPVYYPTALLENGFYFRAFEGMGRQSSYIDNYGQNKERYWVRGPHCGIGTQPNSKTRYSINMEASMSRNQVELRTKLIKDYSNRIVERINSMKCNVVYISTLVNSPMGTGIDGAVILNIAEMHTPSFLKGKVGGAVARLMPLFSDEVLNKHVYIKNWDDQNLTVDKMLYERATTTSSGYCWGHKCMEAVIIKPGYRMEHVDNAQLEIVARLAGTYGLDEVVLNMMHGVAFHPISHPHNADEFNANCQTMVMNGIRKRRPGNAIENQ
uniref:Uncharacterized protein n=1 Tax=Ceratobasidium endornavirus 1 TaxID=2768766 RepID=A0A7G9U7U2_9VIRU|nr:hypothetical protein [Ceratobasidium endornavirus 1]